MNFDFDNTDGCVNSRFRHELSGFSGVCIESRQDGIAWSPETAFLRLQAPNGETHEFSLRELTPIDDSIL